MLIAVALSAAFLLGALITVLAVAQVTAREERSAS